MYVFTHINDDGVFDDTTLSKPVTNCMRNYLFSPAGQWVQAVGTNMLQIQPY